YQPDAVIIDIGTNDMNSGMNVSATFKSTYGTFLGVLRTKYPNAVIYCGSHEGNLSTDIQAVVTTAADSAHVKYILLSGASHGACDGHLDAAGHQTYANLVVAAVKADLGWQ
ncbi:MAG TPA: hypothetical protein VGP93_07105, partial [Polyangiaceae bacterium]|nr:hypothetical protein [Polyangiaceae bacterium]